MNYIGTCNSHVKFGLKIANRLGENVRIPQGDFFESHCRFFASCLLLPSFNFYCSCEWGLTVHWAVLQQLLCLLVD